ncbi:DUF1565 domain-containing protein [bacterium]|nr:DUF1565 domain-containing protein [bacterium]
MKQIASITTIALLVLTLNVISFAGDYYVDAVNGDNGNSGTSADDAWKTITNALSTVSGSEEEPAIIHVNAGTYNMALGEVFPIEMKSNVQIIGAHRETTVIDVEGFDASGIYCKEKEDIVIKGLTITNGKGSLATYESQSYIAGGGVYCETSSISLSKCIIKENNAECGGAICARLFSTLTMTKCIIKNNLSYENGSAIYCSNPDANIIDCVISENVSEMNSCICIFGDSASVNMFNCEISNNIQEGNDGSIIFFAKSSVVKNCLIAGNITNSGYGSGILCSGYSPVIQDCQFIGNSAYDGGGIYCCASSPTINNCLFENNNAVYGGGISIDQNSHPKIINCLIVNNSANDYGGISCLNNSSFNLKNSTIVSNNAQNSDGIYIANGHYALISNCIVWENSIYGRANVTYSDIEGGYEGNGNIDDDPIFVSGPRGDYYLSQITAGQDIDSPCIDAGSEMPIMGFNPKDYITRTDGVGDAGVVDMVYHYPKHVQFGLSVDVGANGGSPETTDVGAGSQPAQNNRAGLEPAPTNEKITVYLDLKTAPAEITVDLYFIMVDADGGIWTCLYWSQPIKPVATGFKLPASMDIESMKVFDFTIPSEMPPISKGGTYTFYIAATKPGTVDFISNIATAGFDVE